MGVKTEHQAASEKEADQAQTQPLRQLSECIELKIERLAWGSGHLPEYILRSIIYANSFCNPLGDGLSTLESDGDFYYVASEFDEPNPEIGGSSHLGADWNGEGGGNTALGDPVIAIGNGTVAAIISDQGSATSGFGNHIVLRHDLPEPTQINAHSVTQVHSIFAHFDTLSAFAVAQQFATQGMSGYAEFADPESVNHCLLSAPSKTLHLNRLC